MRMRRIAWAAVAVSALLTTVNGQRAPRPDLETAMLAWDRGDYVAALTAFKTLLRAQGGEQWLEPIALQTGELFQTREITPDGSNPRFSQDGRFVAYEAGAGASRVTRVVEPGAAMRVVAEVKGYSLAFLPQGDRVVYLKLQPAEELTRAQAELDQAGQTPARLAAQLRLSWLQYKHGDIATRNLSTGQERVCPTEGLLKSAVVPSADGRLLYLTGVREDDPSRSDIYKVAVDCDHPVAVTKEPGYKTGVVVDPKGSFLLYGTVASNPFARPAEGGGGAASAGRPAGGGGRGGMGFGASGSFAILDLKTGTATAVTGASPVLSADGSMLAYVSRSGGETSVLEPAPVAEPVAEKKPASAKPRRAGSRKPLLAVLGAVVLCVAALTLPRSLGIDIPFLSDLQIPSLSEMGIEIPFIGDLFKSEPEDSAGGLKLALVPEGIAAEFVANSSAGMLCVVKGQVRNSYNHPRSGMRVTVKLYTAGNTVVKTATVFAGNVLSNQELSSLDLIAINARLKNSSGASNMNVGVKPGRSVPFMAVFSNLPDGVDEYSVEVAGSTP